MPSLLCTQHGPSITKMFYNRNYTRPLISYDVQAEIENKEVQLLRYLSMPEFKQITNGHNLQSKRNTVIQCDQSITCPVEIQPPKEWFTRFFEVGKRSKNIK